MQFLKNWLRESDQMSFFMSSICTAGKTAVGWRFGLGALGQTREWPLCWAPASVKHLSEMTTQSADMKCTLNCLTKRPLHAKIYERTAALSVTLLIIYFQLWNPWMYARWPRCTYRYCTYSSVLFIPFVIPYRIGYWAKNRWVIMRIDAYRGAQ